MALRWRSLDGVTMEYVTRYPDAVRCIGCYVTNRVRQGGLKTSRVVNLGVGE